LIQIPEQEKDTLAVFNRMLEIKEKFQKQNILEVKNSLKDNSQVIAEDLGYFSAFKMVYAFESVAFNTPVGQVSNPFRTQFGYHVLKVHDKRKSRGEVTVGHIMITDKQNDSLSNPAERIKEIYKLIQQGQPFETLATQFSEDQSSAKNGGKLKPFKSGQLSSVEFENIAFGLSEIGQISKPFKTNYGWHIAKLYDIKNIESFEQLKPNLEQRVQRDARSKMITKSFVTKLRERYSVNEDIDLSYFESIIDSTYNTNSWKSPSESNLDESLFNIGSKQLTFNDFLIFLQRNQKRIRTKMSNQDIIQTQFNALVQEELLKHHEANLELENEEYANVLAEYRDGLLLFDLMEVTIWKAVQADTLALKKYYEENKSKYIWPARIDAVVATSSDPKFASMAKSGFESNTDLEQLKSDINLDKKQNVIFRTGKFEANHRALPEGFVFKEGVSQIYNDKSAYYVVKVNELLSESTKSFTEAKGNVISEYQGQFEAEWLQSLKNKYKVNVNQEVFNKVKAQISQ
jgi:peptidyl-prolyl cis-trans isomerase SurA